MRAHLSSSVEAGGDERHLRELVPEDTDDGAAGDLARAAQREAVHAAEVVVLGLPAVHHHRQQVLAARAVDDRVEALLRKSQRARGCFRTAQTDASEKLDVWKQILVST